VSVLSAPVPHSPAQPPPGLRVADVDRRFYAFAMDRLIAWGIDLAVALVVQHYLLARGHVLLGIGAIVATVLLVGLVFAVMLGVTASTPGTSFLGLRVVRATTGEPLGVGPALLRTAVLGLAAVPFGFGLAALAWTAVADTSRLRRGWHDHLVSSIVLDVRPLPVARESDDSGPRHVVNLTAMRLVPARRTPPAPDPAQVPARAPSRPRHAASEPALEPSERTTVRDLSLAQDAGVPATAETTATPVSWGLAFDTGERVVVDTLVLVGRHPEARAGEQGARLVTLPSADMSVSKTHAQVVVAPDGALVVTDRGSTNGSVLRRQGVAKPLTAGRPATLLDGDVVSVGDRTMTVVRLG
jgi:uncharacterized RDD family membrane protein YckC